MVSMMTITTTMMMMTAMEYTKRTRNPWRQRVLAPGENAIREAAYFALEWAGFVCHGADQYAVSLCLDIGRLIIGGFVIVRVRSTRQRRVDGSVVKDTLVVF